VVAPVVANFLSDSRRGQFKREGGAGRLGRGRTVESESEEGRVRNTDALFQIGVRRAT
jgi:hypothetical protein